MPLKLECVACSQRNNAAFGPCSLVDLLIVIDFQNIFILKRLQAVHSGSLFYPNEKNSVNLARLRKMLHTHTLK